MTSWRWRERLRLAAAKAAVTAAARRARVGGVELCGELAGLDGDGALLLRDASGELHRVRSGDVEVIKPAPAAPEVATAP